MSLFSRQFTVLRLSQRITWTTIRRYATEPPSAIRLREELKDAMKTKDQTRLDVIRDVLSSFKHAEKAGKPFQHDDKVRQVFVRKLNARKQAANLFESKGRQDLADKELAQAAVLENYLNGIPVASAEEVRSAIPQIIEGIKADGFEAVLGSIIQRLRREDGPLGGKVFDFDETIGILKEMGIPYNVVKNSK